MIESARARQAWADYLALGDGRTLDSLVREYQSRTGSVPTTQLSRLKEWSQRLEWQGRLKKLADDAAAEVERQYQERRQAVMGAGLALDYERVRLLKDLAETLHADLLATVAAPATTESATDQSVSKSRPLWYPGIKLASDGTPVQVQEFHESGIRQLRGVLDDIAKEVGGRQSKLDVTSGGEPLKGYVGINPEDV